MTTAQLAEKMQAAANQLPTTRLIEAIRFMGGAVLPQAENMTRAALLSAYEARKGGEALDAIMDEIGL
ncbi:hypothetical protein [Pseudomonas proteolytica]|uniref:hypothetical protein n=1 Tax=Pseudomonas proteolytica TaxID=219574 RepID=UPI001473FBAE|nr:hypothetical protein [Pseudomonas proteolytica]NMZ37089.1 hypothetical protein [Pseudomonas proteolytica]